MHRNERQLARDDDVRVDIYMRVHACVRVCRVYVNLQNFQVYSCI